MELNVTKEVFKSQAKKQHAALKARNVELKLSDIQESLAIAYGYENLATLYATFKKEDYSVVDSKPLLLQKDNLFVVTWFSPEDTHATCDEVMGIYPPGTSLDHIAMRNYSNWATVEKLNNQVLAIPEGLVFSEDTVALKNYSYVPNISRYGLHDGAHESTVAAWVKEFFGFRVPLSGVEVDVYDMGDDGGSKDHILVWLNDDDSAKVRAMFAE